MPKLPPGDARLQEDRKAERQPLSEENERLVRRAYELFDFFYQKLKPAHDEMKTARDMRQLSQPERSTTAPLGSTLLSCIDCVIADQIDNMPEAVMVPEREETATSAEEMSDVVAFVLYHAGWPGVYQQIMEDSAVTGTGIAQVFWDEDAMDGEGMVNVIPWHPEDFYPDPMFENIQDGRAVFKTTHTTVAWVEEHYPEARGYVQSDQYSEQDEQSLFEAPDGDEKVTLIEYWYRRYDAEKKKYRVHMAQLAGHALLYATETGFGVDGGRDVYREGIYAHGLYPFTLYRYRHVWRKPFGTGMVHDYREQQLAIDRYQKYIDDNARQSSIQRHFIRKGSGVNIDDVADWSKTIVEWEGNDIREVMQTVQAAPLNNQVYQMMQYLADTMKQDCGQSQFNRGEGGLGVTAATAIEALQEAGGKTTRWHTEQFKDAFREMVEQILWILSEYIEPGRKLQIVGGWDSSGNMRNRLITLNPTKAEGDALPKPAYSVRVQVQKNNPLQIQADNEFLQQVALTCAQAGQPLPPEAVVGLMEGYRTKSSVLKVVQQNSQTQQQMATLQQQNQQLGAQLESQKRVSNGLQHALMGTQGGGQQLPEQQLPEQQLPEQQLPNQGLM